MRKQVPFPELTIPPGLRDEIEFTKVVEVLDIPYLHLRTKLGDDLYLTQEGLPYLEDLLPRNFARDRDWFNAVKVPLPGSGTVFRVPLKNAGPESGDVVFKWNRMGTDPMVPGIQTPFNSPFEEFSLIAELGARLNEGLKVQQALAVYVPSEEHTLEALQRRRSLMDYLRRALPEQHIDIHRDYAVIYRWVPGLDLYQHVKEERLAFEDAKSISQSIAKMLDERGYAVADHKMSHIIADTDTDFSSTAGFTMIDFELLHRTAKHEVTIRRLRRQRYYEIQLQEAQKPEEQRPETVDDKKDRQSIIFGMPYIEAEIESSGGRLWVAGDNPELIDFFIPEKWQMTPRQRLSRSGGTYLTVTKDDIKLVMKESQVGERPMYDPLHEKGEEALAYGINSPFEEAAVSAAMEAAGLPVIRLRAIYQLNQILSVSEYLKDMSRYLSHEGMTDRNGRPVLAEERQYLTLWQYWEGSDEELLMNPLPLYEPVNLLMAFHRSLVDRTEYETLLRFAGFKLKTKGFRDHALKSTHILFLVDREGGLLRDETGMPVFRYCDFSLMAAPE